MGAYCPPGFAPPKLLAEIQSTILEPTVAGLADEGRPFKGVLYAGLMVAPSGPRVLEFNCRFGDPETQVVLPLLETDLLDAIEAVVAGCLDPTRVAWQNGASCGVVLASEGYPGSFPTGRPITGFGGLRPEALVFHAGTTRRANDVVTAGGRVLTVTGRGASLPEARHEAYVLAAQIGFEGCYHRSDIAADDASATGRLQACRPDTRRISLEQRP